MKMSNLLVLLIVVLILVICLAACGANHESKDASTPVQSNNSEAENASEEDLSFLSEDRIATLNTIKKLTDYDDYNLYSMEVLYDYSLDRLTPTGQVTTQDLMELYFSEAAPGYDFNYTAPNYGGCSAFSLATEEGTILFGRNYDFKFDSSCMAVYCHPKDGYASVAHGALNNVGADDPDSSETAKVACLISPFICIDGINEKGLGISVLTVNSEPVDQNTGKPVLGTTMLIRVVLDKAANTEEAIALLKNYDMYGIAGRDYHFYITDASGDSRAVEFDPESGVREMVVTPTRSISNFYIMYTDKVKPNQSNGIYGLGKERWQAMENVINDNAGIGDNSVAWETIRSAAQDPNPEEITSNTQWSIVYNLEDLSYELVLRRHWDDVNYFSTLQQVCP